MAPAVRAFVALGSNIGSSMKVLTKAIGLVADGTGAKVVACSRVFASKAELLEEQPPFLNAVVQLAIPEEVASQGPLELLRRLKRIEGRFKKSEVRFGPRELDLDIISFGNANEEFTAEDGSLQVPHVRAHLREFVLRPLCDIPQGKGVRLGPSLDRADELLEQMEKNQKRNVAHPVCNAIWSPRKFSTNPAHSDLRCERTMVMGILNVTPDSFSDGGKYIETQKAVEHALRLSDAGADVIDIGGESTRPNAAHVTEDEELERVIPVIEALAKLGEFRSSISIDTRKATVARAAILAGAHIINDEVGEEDDESCSMLAVAGELDVPIISMHARGNARTMENMIIREDGFDIVSYVGGWLRRRSQRALEEYHIPSWNFMVDPGFGFAKTPEQNLVLLGSLSELERHLLVKHPILVGTSRKRFLKNLMKFDIDVTTGATTTAAAFQGASMVRVHNVENAVDSVQVVHAIKQAMSQ